MNQSDSSNIFVFIRNTQLEKVTEFLDGYHRKTALYEYNQATAKNVSAAKISLRILAEIEKAADEAYNDRNDDLSIDLMNLAKKQIKIYENLVSRGFPLGPHEKIGVKLEMGTKIQLRRIHKIYVKNANVRHLTTLISKSKLDRGGFDRSVFHQKITEAYEELNEIDWIASMLRIAANSENLNVIFIFDLERSVKSKEGYCAELKDIYINMDEVNRLEALANLAGKLTIFALQEIYRNESKPYSEESEYKQRLIEILAFCESKKSNEPLIESVFKCPPDCREAELISRVPQLLMFYKSDEQKLNEVKSIFPELFDFYKNKTKVDFDHEHPIIEARFKMKELNELIGVAYQLQSLEISLKLDAQTFTLDYQKVSLVQSNYTHLSMRLIYQQLSIQENFETAFIFAKLDTLENETILKLIVESFRGLTEPTLILECDEQKPEKVLKIIKTFRSENINERIVIFHNIESIEVEDVEKSSIEHSWSHLTPETQEKLWYMKVNFQGVQISLKDILPIDSLALNLIPLKLLVERTIKIGEDLQYPIIPNYIKRFFLPENSKKIEDSESYTIEWSSEELIEIAKKNRQVILFSDDPGMGKTTEFKEMAKRIKREFPLLWVLFVDLKEYFEFYERDGMVTKVFETSDDVAKYYCENILKLDDFQSRVFTQFLNESRIVFLLDGFDEISPSFKQFNLKLSNAIRIKTTNALWVTTRPHLESELKDTLKTEAIRLKPLNYEDRLNFMKRMLESKGFEGEILDKKFQKIDELLSNLRRNSQLSGAVSNPILLRIITEIFEDEVGDLVTNANFYSVYQSFIKKIVDNFLKKGYQAISDSAAFLTNSTDIMASHQKRALEVIFAAAGNDEIREAIENCYEDFENLSVEQITRVGFTVSDSNNRLQFIHRTFTEFFCADFFFRNLFGIDVFRMNAVTLLFHEAFYDLKGTSGMIGTFFEGVIEVLSHLSDTLRLQSIKNIFKEKFSVAEIRFVFHNSVEKGHINIIKVLPVHSENNEQLWHGDEGNVFIIAAEHQTTKLIENLISLAEQVFDSSTLGKMIIERDNKDDTIFTAALHNRNPEVSQFFLNHPKITAVQK